MKLYKDNKTKIFNPVTARYVKISGAVGRRLERMTDSEYNELGAGAGAGASTEEGGVKIFSTDRTKIMNPTSGRMVAVDGSTGRKLLKMSNDEYEKLKSVQPEPKKTSSKKSYKRSEALKKVIREEQAKTIVRGVRRADELTRARQEQEVGDKLDELIEQEFGVEEEKEEAKEEAKEEVPRGHSIRDTARAVAAQEEIEEVIQEFPEVTRLPRGRTIRDIARALARGDYFELDAIARAIPPQRPAFERSVTELVPYVEQPVLERSLTEETMPSFPPRPPFQRAVTEEVPFVDQPVLERSETAETMLPSPELEQYQVPSQEGANTLDILLNVTDVLEEITEKLEQEEEAKEEEKAVGMTSQEIDDLIFNQIEDAIRLERMAEMKRIKEELKKAEEIDEQVWNDANYDLYALEPVEDDMPAYKDTWEDAVDELNELVEEEFGVEESKEEAKEQGQVFDDLTTAMGMENMGEEVKEEEKRQMTMEESIEGLRRNLMNLEFLDSGRSPYQSASSVPDPHLDAFSHIAESKK